MRHVRLSSRLGALATVLFLLGACAPAAAPSPTTAPAQPAASRAPVKTEPRAMPAATQASDAQPTSEPAAKSRFDEKVVAEFYQGKTIRLIVGAGAGGGYDTYSRLIARHIGKYIPGTPNVIVENMGGGGSLLATNYVYNVAPRDGTVMESMQGSVIGQQVFGAPGIEFDGAKLHYLGAPTSDNYVTVVAKRAGVSKLDQILDSSAQQIVLGGDAPGNMLQDSAVLLRDVLGANIKLVSGYDGTAKIRLAMENGEVDGVSGFPWQSFKNSSLDRLESGEWLVLVQLTEQPIPDLPRTPLIMSYAKNDEQRQMLRQGIIAPGKFGRPYVVHPEVPADRVAALQAAFAKTMADKEFLAEAEKSKLDISPMSADEVRDIVMGFMNTPAAIKDKLQQVLRPSGG